MKCNQITQSININLYDVLNLFIFAFVAAFTQNDKHEGNKSHKNPCIYSRHSKNIYVRWPFKLNLWIYFLKYFLTCNAHVMSQPW